MKVYKNQNWWLQKKKIEIKVLFQMPVSYKYLDGGRKILLQKHERVTWIQDHLLFFTTFVFGRAQLLSGGVFHRCYTEELYLEITQENTCAAVTFLVKLKFVLHLTALLKKRLRCMCSPVNLTKFFIKPFHRASSGNCFYTVHQLHINSIQTGPFWGCQRLGWQKSPWD